MPQFENFPNMKFDKEPCSWRMLARNEVLSPFAPRSAWMWRPRELLQRQKGAAANTRADISKGGMNEAKLDRFLGSTALLRLMRKNVKDDLMLKKRLSTRSLLGGPRKNSRRRIIICNRSQVRCAA